MPEFTVKRVGRENAWQGRRGDFVDYWLAATDEAGTEYWCFTTRKPESPAPQADEVIYGHLEHREAKSGKVHVKLVKDQRPDTGPSTGTPARIASGSQGEGTGSGGTSWDERSARIERQHSQEMSLRLLVARDFGGLRLDEFKKLVKEWTDWFVADLDNASPQALAIEEPAERAAVSAPPPPSPVTPAQKRKITTLLKENVAEDHWDALRAEATDSRSASTLIDALVNRDGHDVLLGYGITPKSETAEWVDDGGLPPAPDVSAIDDLEYDDEVPF